MTFKLALKNISSKPWRAVATVFVVAVAVSLIFAMLSFSNAVYDYLFQVETAGAGNSDITIKTNSTSDRIFGVDGLESIDGVDTVVPTLNLYGLYKGDYLSLRGFDKGDYQTLSKMEIIDGDVSAIDQNTDNVVISESMAKAYELSIGSSLEIEMGERKVAFYVVAIAEDSGYFLASSPYTVIGNVKGVSRLIFGEQAVYNEIYLTVQDGVKVEDVIDKILAVETYSQMSVSASQDVEYIQNHTDSMSAPVVIAGLGVYVLAMAFVVLIAFTSLTERKKFVAKLTVIGATKSQILFTFLWEVLILAFGGAVMGSILAGGVFALLLKLTLSSTVAFSVSVLKLFISSAIGFITAVLAVIVPIATTLKSTVRANENEKKSKSVVSVALPIALVLVAIVSVIVEHTAKGGKGAMSMVNLVLVLLSVVVAVPSILRLVAILLSKVQKSIVQLSAKTVARERRHTRLQILTAGMTVAMLMFMAWSVTTDIFTGYLKEFEDKVFVTNITSSTLENGDIDGILQMDGVKNAIPMVWKQGSIVETGKSQNVNILGSENTLDIVDFEYITDEKTIREKLLENGNVVIDKAYQELYKINVGDKITLDVDGKSATLTVCGIVSHNLFNGNYAVVSLGTLKDVYGMGADTILVVADDASNTADAIRSQYAERNYYAIEALTMYKWDAESLGSVFDLVGTLAFVMAVLVYMVLVAGAVASRPSGEKARTAFLSAGMSKNTLLGGEVIEYALTGLVAFMVSFGTSALMTSSLIGALRIFGLYFDFMYSAGTVAIVGAVLTVGYVLIPILANFKKGYSLKKQSTF